MFKYLNFVLLFVFSLAFSQTTKLENSLITSELFNEFHVEKFFLDTDKNQYFPGETVWFKVYILEESTLKLNTLTEKTQISLYKNKELIETQALLINNGISFGKFQLNKDLKSGQYYFQLNTNYNSNFNAPINFAIDVISTSKNDATSIKKQEIIEKTTSANTPILNFHPESNILLNAVHNKVIISTNLPKNTLVEIIDTKNNKKIATLNIDKDHNTIAFFKNQSTYKASVNFNTKTYDFNFPVAQNKGFTIFKNRIAKNAPNKTFILKTNQATLKDYLGKSIFVALHKKGTLKSFTKITLNSNKLEYLLSFSNNDLFNGINTISILNEEKEQLVDHYFFNEQNVKIEAEFNTISKDSIQVSLKSKQIKNMANLSIAVHSKDFNQSKPNIKSTVYLNNMFLAQTLNKYELESDFINNYLQIIASKTKAFPYQNVQNKDYLFTREKGFKINGSINSIIKNIEDCKVMLKSNENSILLVEDLKPDKTFSFSNIYLQKNSNYELALLDKKGRIIDANFYVYNQHSEFSNKSNINVKPLEFSKFEILNKKPKNTQYIYFPEAEELEEVNINYEKESEVKLKKALRDNGIIGSAFSTVYTVQNGGFTTGNIIQYLQTLRGFSVKYNTLNQPYLNNNRPSASFTDLGDRPIAIIMDGMLLGNDLSQINFMLASEFEYVIFNANGAGFGPLYPNGVLNLITFKGMDGQPLPNRTPNIKSFVADFGFSKNYKRFEASLITYGTQTLSNTFKTIDWHPNISLFKDKTTRFNIRTEGLKDLKLTINGVTASGQLIYTIIKN